MIEAHGKCIIPGLVDAHTHAVWAGDRVHEFAMKVYNIIYYSESIKINGYIRME